MEKQALEKQSQVVSAAFRSEQEIQDTPVQCPPAVEAALGEEVADGFLLNEGIFFRTKKE